MKIYLIFLVFAFQCSFAQSDSIYNIGKKLINENKLEEAISYFNKNLKTTKSQEQRTHILFGLADVYKLQFNYNKSGRYYSQAYYIIKKVNNVQLAFLYHVKIAEFYRKRAMHHEFEIELNKAEKILKVHKIKDKYKTKYYNRKAALFTERYQNNDSTLFYANKSLELAKKINDNENVFYSLLEIASVYESKKDYKTSIDYIEEIIELAKKNNMIQQQADAYISYIMALARSNQLEKALKVALHAANFSKEHKLFYHEIIFHDNIQNLYFRLHNTKKAYEYLKDRLELTTKYNELKKEELIFSLETKYKLKEKENQIKIDALEIENKNKELITTKANFTLILGLFFTAIISILLIAYFLKKTKQKNRELQLLSKQNQFLVSETNHRVNNNLQLIAVLIENKIRKNRNENEKAEFTRFLKKVDAIAALHRLLYVTNNVNIINLQEYLMNIKNNFEELVLEENINLNVTIEDTKINSDTALYLGLLITELFINSIKHAFNEHQQKTILLSLIVKESKLFFNYQDNGENSKKIELKPALVEQLCLQLEVDYTINSSQGFQINFIKNHSKNA